MFSISSVLSPRTEIRYRELPSETSLLESPQSRENKRPRPRVIAVGICILCTLVNLFLIRGPSSTTNSFPLLSRTSNGLYTRRQIDSLRRPSQFIGLQNVHRGTPPPSLSTTIYAHVISPVSKNKPSEVYGNDPKSYFSPHGLGTISPEDRQIKVSDSTSTIMQFRVMDFGMEVCELHISIPKATNSSSEPSLKFPSVPLNIHLLDKPEMLYADTLSYSTRPTRKQLFARVRLEYGMEWSHHFGCSMDDLLTFEISCPPPHYSNVKSDVCELGWWQDKENPSPGITLIQHSTR
ncbi:hypothetical protein E1B28_002073 [Marasmius oreades]|uniref:Ubiquitin 3 binding protein But2 C-terminal domain-containing protein n=1 Tax=Marasmius oreades TaxID=181124 RepID=A0A9P7V4T7_9AGAR|nr:uncharacterized protein E1B28_002073 [Marasmius oreades]KAG7100298.1 hypothetical protein E1B28_002073 [Marasmius oreades]